MSRIENDLLTDRQRIERLLPLLLQPQPDFNYDDPSQCALGIYGRAFNIPLCCAQHIIRHNEKAAEVIFLGADLPADTPFGVFKNVKPHHVHEALTRYLTTGEIVSPVLLSLEST